MKTFWTRFNIATCNCLNCGQERIAWRIHTLNKQEEFDGEQTWEEMGDACFTSVCQSCAKELKDCLSRQIR